MNFEEKLNRIEAPAGHKSVLRALNNHHAPTAKHCIVVADLTKRFLRSIGENEQDVRKGYLAALIHDAGKLALPSELLNKKEALTPEERIQLSDHTSGARAFLDGTIKQSEKGDTLRTDGISVFDIYTASCHHENYRNVPYLVRAIEICDVYAALTENRAYRDPSTMRQALHIMWTDNRQKGLDRQLLNKFAIYINSYEVNKERQNIKDYLESINVDYKNHPGIYLIQNQNTDKIIDLNDFKLFPGYWYGIDSSTNELICTSGRERNGDLKVFRSSEHVFTWMESWEKESDIPIKAYGFKAPEIKSKLSFDEYIDYYIGKDNDNFEQENIEKAYFDYLNDGLPYFARVQYENASEDAMLNHELIKVHNQLRNDYISENISHMPFDQQYKIIANEMVERYDDELDEFELEA